MSFGLHKFGFVLLGLTLATSGMASTETSSSETSSSETSSSEASSCGLLKDSWLAKQIENLQTDDHAPELSAKVSDVSNTASSKVEIQADKIDFPERNVVYLTGYTRLTQNGNMVSADELVYDKEARIVEARGMVRLTAQDGDVVETTQLLYDIASRNAHADGEVQLVTAKGDFINAVNLHYDLDAEVVKAGAADFVFASRGANSPVHIGDDRQISAFGSSEALWLYGTDVVELRDVVVTTCLDGREDMKFTADVLRVDLLTGNRKAKNAQVMVIAPSEYRSLAEVID